MRARLVVFARNEAPGRMKTRLSPPLTPEEAAALSVAMAEALMERLSGFGSPPADFGSPPAGIGSPPAGIESPPAGFGTPPAGLGSPPAGIGSPPAGIGSPPAGIGSPPAGFGTPPAGLGSPPAEFGSPPADFGSPPAGLGSPPAEFGSPPAEKDATEPAALETSRAGAIPPNPTALAAPPRQSADLELRYTGEPPRRAAGDGRSPLSSAPDAGAPLPPGPETGTSGLAVPAGWSAVPQGDGDLGDRLTRTADAAASAGVERLVIAGADAPLLPLSLVERAFAALGDRPVALAPAEDGGFVLLGLAAARLSPASVASLLREVPWGTAEVFESTLRNAARARLEVAALPSSWDVDRPDDLPRLRRAVAALPPAERPRRLHALLSGIPAETRPSDSGASEPR